MAETTEPIDARVGLYIDFDNIVISRYQQLHGRNAFQRDGIRDFDKTDPNNDPEIAARLAAATVDFSAIIDFAASFGTTVVNRAYADWSVPVNASYQRQLMSRAVDLTQLFTTTTRGTKNGADIRLAVDVVEDLFRLPDLTHVIIVAGDSDYIALAQKAKRLGRFVVGIGVAGSTSTSLAAACDEFEDYDSLPGIEKRPEVVAPAGSTSSRRGSKKTVDAAAGVVDAGSGSGSGSAEADAETEAEPKKAPARSRRVTIPMFSHTEDVPFEEPEPEPEDAQTVATELLVRALQIGHAKGDADEWLNTGSVKNQMRRMDPSFNEKPLGYRSFTDFLASRDDVAELAEEGQQRLIRLLSSADAKR